MLEQGLTTLLNASTSITALIGDRLYPVFVPQSPTYPCLSYQVISGSSSYSMDGSAETVKRIQFDAWGTTYADVKNIQQALHNLLDGFEGVLSDGTAVHGTFRGVELDEFENDSLTYRTLTEYSFHFVE